MASEVSPGVLICGPPRSGTTLLFCMLRYAVTSHKTLANEAIPAAGSIGKVPHRMLQGPDNAIVLMRDPRAILTSVHSAPQFRGKYFVAADRCINRRQGLLEYAKALDKCTNPLVVRYESLVADTWWVERILANRYGMEFSPHRPMEEFWKGNHGPKLEYALNGKRPLDSGHDWRKHMERVWSQFKDHPRLFRIMEEWGYAEYGVNDKADWWREVLDSKAAGWRGDTALA